MSSSSSSSISIIPAAVAGAGAVEVPFPFPFPLPLPFPSPLPLSLLHKITRQNLSPFPAPPKKKNFHSEPSLPRGIFSPFGAVKVVLLKKMGDMHAM